MHRAKAFSAPIPPHQQGTGGHKDLGGYTCRTADPNQPQGHPRPYGVNPVYKAGWGEGKGRHLEWWCLSFQVTVTCDGAQLSWDGWAPACPRKWGMNSWFGFACAHTSALLFSLYHIPQVFSLLPFQFPVQFHGRGGGGAELPPSLMASLLDSLSNQC